VFREWNYEGGRVHLARGDRLILFTDGITEAMRSNSEESGEDGILHAAHAGASLSPGEFNSHLLAEVNQFCNLPTPR
jgi:serine phosphatase RsbU (regulator of sigma subunit)